MAHLLDKVIETFSTRDKTAKILDEFYYVKPKNWETPQSITSRLKDAWKVIRNKGYVVYFKQQE
jgi:hypothetical protein